MCPFFSDDFHFPYRGVVGNILGHLTLFLEFSVNLNHIVQK